MSTELPPVKRAKPADAPPPQAPQVATTEPGADWREAMMASARAAASRVAIKERARNPMIPDNFLDVSDSGFPADITVLGVQIPRPGVPQEMAQYRDMINLQWLHVPWSFISKNGGEDGKAHVPGVAKYDLGGGEFVAVLAGNFLMYANREQYQQRRVRNANKADESLQYKVQNRLEEATEDGKRRNLRVESSDPGPMSLEGLLEYEQRIGDEAPIEGVRIER
jgi:hypothetical protein